MGRSILAHQMTAVEMVVHSPMEETKMSRLKNEEMVRKAIITATEHLASNGKLTNEQANVFIDYVFAETMLSQMARTFRFSPETMDIPKIGVGSRVTMAATEAQDPARRRGVATSKISLTPKEVITPFEISDTFAEINVEQQGVEDHVVRMMATQMGNDLEELMLDGDTLGPAAIEGSLFSGGHATHMVKDAFLALLDGWLKVARNGNVVDAGGTTPVGVTLFGQMLRAMPTKFRRNRAQLRYIMSMDLETLYREKVSARETQGGDTALTGAAPLTIHGVPILAVPLMSFKPTIVEHFKAATSGSHTMAFAPITDVVVTPQALDEPTAKFILDTDYSQNLTAGTITNLNAGIANDALIKVTYKALPQIMLTHVNNLIAGIGRDIRVERDRDIYRRANQFAITAKTSCNIEETDALVLGANIKDSI